MTFLCPEVIYCTGATAPEDEPASEPLGALVTKKLVEAWLPPSVDTGAPP